MVVGYARVSTNEQNLDLQLDALEKAECKPIFKDPSSGSRNDRPGLKQALEYVREGDTLVVWKLDRLGRSLKHLIETVTTLNERGIGFKRVFCAHPQALLLRPTTTRPEAVDTLGLLLSVYTSPANKGDRWGAKACVGGMKHFLPRLKTIWADSGYSGDDLALTCAGNGWELVVVKRPQERFEVQPKRWIVERTLAWLLKSRRLVVDYERRPQTGESFIHIAMSRLMLRRLAASIKVSD
jgi:transposase